MRAIYLGGNIIGKTWPEPNLPPGWFGALPQPYRPRPGVWRVAVGSMAWPVRHGGCGREPGSTAHPSGGGFYSRYQFLHLLEHSIEVNPAPFLQAKRKARKLRGIVPVTVGTQNPQFPPACGQGSRKGAGPCRKTRMQEVVVSSGHEPLMKAKSALWKKDNMALESALAADPDTLLETVAREEISMCGAGPLALALYAGFRLWASF